MSQLLPNRHPNKDFFIVDIADASPKNDMASMEHPIFSLSVKPDLRNLEYQSKNGELIKIVPSGYGLATIMDKDILLYAISKLVHEKNQGREISQWVEVSAHEVMVATNWRTNKTSYERFENALVRLKGTVILTDIKTGGKESTKGFGLIDEFEIERKNKEGETSAFGRMSKVKIKLSDWTMRAIEGMEVLTICSEYFRLRRPLERRLYELARKHVGSRSEPWKIGIENLRNKVGTVAPSKKFKFNLKEIISDGNIPEYGFRIEGDNVIIQRLLTNTIEKYPTFISLRPDTYDKAQKIAAEIRTSVFDLEREWNEWASKKTEPPKNADAAFIAFCNKKKGSDGAKRVVEVRQMAML